jgi:deoxycytidine triphosphate deaminase
MSVLSDGEIRRLIAEAQMIEGADDERVISCSYEFRPGAIVSTGSDQPEGSLRNWTSPTTPEDIYAISPGELVWIRTRETVSMPPDICAFWWQTNRLSRQGLMLVNMSMVEPGYEGPLACLFANFGKQPVIIEPDTVVAKLVFNRLSSPAEKPLNLSQTTIRYDRGLLRDAMNAPVTFLDVGSINTSLTARRDDAIAEMGKALSGFKLQLGEEADEVKKATREQFNADSSSLIRRVLGAAAIGFILVVVAVTFVPWLQSEVQPGLSTEIQQDVNNSLTQRLVGTGSVGNSEVAQLQRQVHQLQQEIKTLQPRATRSPR